MLKQTNVAWNATDGLTIGFTGLVQRTDTDEISVEVNEDNLADYATKAELTKIVQTTGTSTTEVMSQKAVTDAIENAVGTIDTALTTLDSGTGV